jgi:polysaccharide export outer membrane protein
MPGKSPSRGLVIVAVCTLAALTAGCHFHGGPLPPESVPHELAKVPLPDYVIEPPDILKIDALTLIPLPPYKVQPLDVLAIRVPTAPKEDPIDGLYSVEPDGAVDLGPFYGRVELAGKTLDESKKALTEAIRKKLAEALVTVFVVQGRGVQQIRGEHLVRPDGTVSLGSYGSVRVAGLTIASAKAVIEQHLSKYLQKPEVSVDVLAYNSKVYYVIFDQGGSGQRIFRLPITGNDTVLDAFGQVSGLSVVSDEKKMWLARATPDDEPDLVLPIDWHAVTKRGRTETNYQLWPGDRIFVQADKMVWLDTKLGRFLSPGERIFGFSLLGASTVSTLRFKSSSSNSSSGSSQ